MESFRYKARDEKGKIISGVMQANNEVDLHEKLKAENRLLIDAKLATKSRGGKRMKGDRLSDFARNLSKLLGAGVSLVRTMSIIADDESIKENERKLYKDILKQIRSGTPFSNAIENEGDAFPTLFVNMMRSAEQSGNMDKTAANMADYYSKEYRLNQKISSSMTYPKILVFLIIAVVAIIMGFVIPQFSSLFATMDSLPVATTILLGISNFVASKWYVLIFFGIILYVVWVVVGSIPAVKMWKAKVEIHLPKIGKLRKIVYTARFARTLSSLYSAGMPIVACLNVAKTTIGNVYIESQFDDMIAKIRAGGNLSEAIEEIDGFVKKLPSSIMVGEETGQLDSMLISIADQMDYDSEIAIEKLVAMIEPLMIVIMAVVVGFIMLAVIQPIYSSYQSISNMS